MPLQPLICFGSRSAISLIFRSRSRSRPRVFDIVEAPTIKAEFTLRTEFDISITDSSSVCGINLSEDFHNIHRNKYVDLDLDLKLDIAHNNLKCIKLSFR